MFLSQLGPDQRESAVSQLATEQFDILVIGGGVTGVGAALDAASRGLKVAVFDILNNTISNLFVKLCMSAS
jgi:glycerol-3-phosphate dehydrogenase